MKASGMEREKLLDRDLKPDPGVQRYCEYFEQAEWSTATSRELSERDRDYRDGKQLTQTQRDELTRRGQPPIVFNRIQRKVDFLSGLEKQQRKDPKAFPRNPRDKDAADAATDAIRYVCDDQRWDMTRSKAWKYLLVEGTAAVMVDVRETRDGNDPRITCIAWDRFFYDPRSSCQFFSDARYMGIVTWYDLADAEAKWPDGEDALAAAMVSDASSDTYDDKPKTGLWVDSKNRRVRVVEMYYREGGEWRRCVFTRGGFLESPEASPFIDEEGRPENPIKAASLYVDRDNMRYGAVRVMIDPQDEINKRRSKLLWRSTARQVRVSPAVSTDAEKIRKELSRPDGVFVGERGDVEIFPGGDLLNAEVALLQESKAEIDLLGPNASLSGKNENDMSGRAILAQQQGGMVEVADQFDTLRELTLEIYRAVWNRIRQVWEGERWVRVTDNDRNMRFVGLNQQVTLAQIAEEVAQGDQRGMASAVRLVGPQIMQAFMAGDQQAQMQLGLLVQQYGGAVVETRNAVTELDVDIVIDEGMDTPTVQAEQFDTLVKTLPGLAGLMESQSPVARTLMQMLVQASQLRDKDKLLEILDGMAAGPSPEQQALQQLQMAGAQAQVEKTQSETVRNIAQARNAGGQPPPPPDPVEQLFRMAELETDQFEAVTNRLQALQPDYGPRQAA